MTHITDIQNQQTHIMSVLAFHLKQGVVYTGFPCIGLCSPFLNLHKYSNLFCRGLSHINSPVLLARYALKAMINNNYNSSNIIATQDEAMTSINVNKNNNQYFSNLAVNKNIRTNKTVKSQKSGYLKKTNFIINNKSVDLSSVTLKPLQNATKYANTIRSNEKSSGKTISATDQASKNNPKKEILFSAPQQNYSLASITLGQRNSWLSNKHHNLILPFIPIKNIASVISNPLRNIIFGITGTSIRHRLASTKDRIHSENFANKTPNTKQIYEIQELGIDKGEQQKRTPTPLRSELHDKSTSININNYLHNATKITNLNIKSSMKDNIINLLKYSADMKSEIQKELNQTVIYNNKQLLAEIKKQTNEDTTSSVKSITDDSVVRILLEKMRLLDREERFRLGLVK